MGCAVQGRSPSDPHSVHLLPALGGSSLSFLCCKCKDSVFVLKGSLICCSLLGRIHQLLSASVLSTVMQTFTLASIALCPGQGCLGALPRPHGPVLWGRRPCGGLGADLGGGEGPGGGMGPEVAGPAAPLYPAESLLQHGVRLWALGFGLRPGELPVEQLLSAGQRRAALRRG